MTTLIVFALLLGAQRAVPAHETVRPGAREVGRVNGVPILADRLEAAVNALIPLESFHRKVSATKLADLREKALHTLVDEELVYQEGRRLGITVPESDIDAGLAATKKRYKTEQAFEDARRRSGESMADIRREIRRSLTIHKTYERAVTAQCQVGRDETSRYFAANPDRFVMPEQLHLYAITIGVDPSAASIVWLNAKARAQDIRRQILAGASFEDLARKHSTDAASRDKGGDMGFVHRGSLTDAFETAVRGLKAGGLSEVVGTLYGYHVIRVAEIRPPQKKAFADVAADLQKDLTTKRCAEVQDRWLSDLRAHATIVLPQAAR